MEKKHIVLDEAAAERLSEVIDGPKVVLSLWIVQKLDCDLELAAFVSFSAFLSSCCKAQGGWFFLEQEKVPDPNSESMFLRLGSWKYGVGLGKDAQLRARKRAKQMGILAEKPSKTKARKLEQRSQEEESVMSRSAFIFEQMRGAPPRLHYRVDKLKYIAWLAIK